MAWLKIGTLSCGASEDIAVTEELCIVVDSRRAGGVSGLRPGDAYSFAGRLPHVEFNTKAKIDVWSEVFSLIHLGTLYTYAEDAGKGELSASFGPSGTGYALTYEVLW